MKYFIYIAVALLIVWAVYYVVKSVRRQMKGDCSSCGGGCNGNCSGCSSCGSCPSQKK